MKNKNLRDCVLDVYTGLKQQIDNGELVDAFVTDAYVGKDGEFFINVDAVMPATISEIKIDVVLTR